MYRIPCPRSTHRLTDHIDPIFVYGKLIAQFFNQPHDFVHFSYTIGNFFLVPSLCPLPGIARQIDFEAIGKVARSLRHSWSATFESSTRVPRGPRCQNETRILYSIFLGGEDLRFGSQIPNVVRPSSTAAVEREQQREIRLLGRIIRFHQAIG